MAANFNNRSCPLCSFQVTTTAVLLSHLRTVHSSDPNFTINFVVELMVVPLRRALVPCILTFIGIIHA